MTLYADFAPAPAMGAGAPFKRRPSRLPMRAVLIGTVAVLYGAGASGQTELGAGRPPVRVSPEFEAPPDPPPARPSDSSVPGGCDLPPGHEYLYLHSGEFHCSAVDLEIRGRGIDFVWARKYRSRLGSTTALGHGWDFSYNIWVERSGHHIIVHDGNTRADIYHLQPAGTYVADQFFHEGTFDEAGSFVLTFADKGTWNFNPFDGSPSEGKIQSIVDRNGNTIAFLHDGAGHLTTITDTLLRQVHVAYNGDGFIESVTDWTGRSVTYEYYRNGDAGGSLGDLKSVTTPPVTGTPNGNDFPDGKTTTYTYSKDVSTERLNHNLLSITDPKGQAFLRVEYQGPGDRVTRLFWGNPNEVIDLVRVPQPFGDCGSVVNAIVNDRVGNVKEYSFDARHRCVLFREYTGRAVPDQPTTDTENRPQNPLRPDDPPFFETRYEWNEDSRPVRIVHPNGNITERVYERELDPAAPPRSRGHLRILRYLAGSPFCDPPEITETFDYDSDYGSCCGSNFVTRHVDGRGHETFHAYDENGNRIQTCDRIPTIVEDFAYNEFGQLTEHVLPDNGSGWRRADRYVYYTAGDGHQNGYLKHGIVDADNLALTSSNEYDAVGNLIRTLDPGGRDSLHTYNQLDQIVRQASRELEDGGGLRYQIDTYYDANDNVVQVDTLNISGPCDDPSNTHFTTRHEYGVLNELLRTIEEVDQADNVVTEYDYDANRNVVLTRHGEAVSGGQPDNVIATHYDERDLPFQEIRAPGASCQSATQFDYDANGNRVRLLEGLEDNPAIQALDYDCYDRLTTFTDPMGNVSEFAYDANGNCVHERLYGELADLTGSSGNMRLSETNRTYDEMDRLIRTETLHFDPETQQPFGDGVAVTLTAYNGNSQVVQVTDDNGHATCTVYDTANRVLYTIDAKGNTIRNDYGANGNIVMVSETELSDLGNPPATFVTTYGYDNQDRLTRETDSAGHSREYGYDSRSNRTRLVDGLGNVTCSSYDGLNRLVTTRRMLTDDGTGGGNPIGEIVTMQVWDDSSRLVARIDDNGNVTQYSYDPLDRLISLEYADGTTHTYSYDVHDNQVTVVDANGSVQHSTYDLLKRLAARSIVPGPAVSDDTTFESYQYDGLSRVVRAEDDDSVVLRGYDSLGLCTRETLDGHSTTSLYDGLGNELTCTYPSGRILSCTYDELNRKKALADTLGGIADYDYVGPSRVERRRYTRLSFSPITSLYTFDNGRRTSGSIHVPAADLPVIDARSYAWDADGNKLVRSDVRAGGPRWTHAYGYDSVNRLVRTLVTDGFGNPVRDTQYVIDGVGNRHSVIGDDCPGTYSMDPTPPVLDYQVNQYSAIPCASRLYDENGNYVAGDLGTGHSVVLTYDYRNQPVAHFDSVTGITTSFAYDAFSRRIEKSDDSSWPQTTRYFYHGHTVCEEQDALGMLLVSYVYGVRDTEVLHAQSSGSEFYYFAGDLDSVVAVSDVWGLVLERYEYQDYGAPMFFDGAGSPMLGSALGNSYLFTGQRFDSESGFYYCRTRYLDPVAGRFTTRDSVGIWEDEPNLGNGTSYVGNNPASFVDPSGRKRINSNCNGRLLRIKTSDCDATGQVRTAGRACQTLLATRRAYADVLDLLTNDMNYGAFNWTERVGRTRTRVDTWFGGGDNWTGIRTKAEIEKVFRRVKEALETKRTKYECEAASNTTCQTRAGGFNPRAYVREGMKLVHLCDDFFTISTQQQVGLLFHELTHARAATDDEGYWDPASRTDYSDINGRAVNLSESDLRKNASTYQQFLLQYYVR
ncbi:MAG: RHS repeat-associated core domain-containing protein [Planctomycetota bacterium]